MTVLTDHYEKMEFTRSCTFCLTLGACGKILNISYGSPNIIQVILFFSCILLSYLSEIAKGI